MFLIIISVLFFSVVSDVQKKIIRNKDFDIECYVSLKKVKSYDSDKMYYWFKSGEIHHSLSSSEGLVLHADYVKYYKSNQLAEKGTFNYGLKDDVWRSWYINGNVKTSVKWKEGQMHGHFISYDSLSNTLESGTYKNDIKTGQWINHSTKDTLHYKNGDALKSADIKREGFFKRLMKPFKKKDSTKTRSQKKKRTKNNGQKKKDKDSFFKRLFKKKSTTD